MRKHFVLVVVAAVLLVSGALAFAKGDKPRRIDIAVSASGFEPAKIEVEKDEPVVLVFTRKTEETCAKQVIVHVNAKDTMKKDLPLNKPVEVAVTFTKSGELAYACGMNMVTGVISVQ